MTNDPCWWAMAQTGRFLEDLGRLPSKDTTGCWRPFFSAIQNLKDNWDVWKTVSLSSLSPVDASWCRSLPISWTPQSPPSGSNRCHWWYMSHPNPWNPRGVHCVCVMRSPIFSERDIPYEHSDIPWFHSFRKKIHIIQCRSKKNIRRWPKMGKQDVPSGELT